MWDCSGFCLHYLILSSVSYCFFKHTKEVIIISIFKLLVFFRFSNYIICRIFNYCQSTLLVISCTNSPYKMKFETVKMQGMFPSIKVKYHCIGTVNTHCVKTYQFMYGFMRKRSLKKVQNIWLLYMNELIYEIIVDLSFYAHQYQLETL